VKELQELCGNTAHCMNSLRANGCWIQYCIHMLSNSSELMNAFMNLKRFSERRLFTYTASQ